ncbi:MAG: LysM peptidoglycan-binding domain-containing protein [Bacteriovoracaceae bacterium]|nr:LysM peptidoglycan-binding domain-containing protein [Bacteriovoracaceae bacterium]
MKKKVFVLAILFGLSSCLSMNDRSVSSVDGEPTLPLDETVDVGVDTSQEFDLESELAKDELMASTDSLEVAEGEEVEKTEDVANTEPVEIEPVGIEEVQIAQEEPAKTDSTTPFYEDEQHQIDMPISEAQGYSIYTAKGHETLMLIAFYVYTDYRAWKKIKEANKDTLADFNSIPAGTEIKLPHPLKVWNAPKGRPYLIKKADTLSLISKKVYGKYKYWPAIYENNRDQIEKPELIFEGFTIFYPSQPEKFMGPVKIN